MSLDMADHCAARRIVWRFSDSELGIPLLSPMSSLSTLMDGSIKCVAHAGFDPPKRRSATGACRGASVGVSSEGVREREPSSKKLQGRRDGRNRRDVPYSALRARTGGGERWMI